MCCIPRLHTDTNINRNWRQRAAFTAQLIIFIPVRLEISQNNVYICEVHVLNVALTIYQIIKNKSVLERFSRSGLWEKTEMITSTS